MSSVRGAADRLVRMWNGVRLTFRRAWQRPSYAVAIISVLAFGLGSCTAIFSALYCAVLKPLPYPDPDGLVEIHNRFPALHLESMKASPADYFTLRGREELFGSVGAYVFLDLSRSGMEVPEKVNAVAVTSSLLGTLGVRPKLGRTFTDAEEHFGGPHAVLLSDAYWHSAFGADRGVLNRTLTLNGEPYSIVGVMPKSFAFPNEVTQMWAPLTFRNPADSRNYYLRVYARLAPGLGFARASARLEELSRQIARENPQLHEVAPRGWSYFVSPMVRNGDASARRGMWILFAAAVSFLLILCANVAGLVLVRCSERRFEFGVRVALGAGKGRIVSEVLGEVLLLAGLGGAAGLALARGGIALLGRFGPMVPPPDFEAPVFWFAVAVTLATGVLCGLYPALHSAGGAAGSAIACLGDGGNPRAAGPVKRVWQRGLTVGQIAVATALLVCGGLLVRSLLRVLEAPLGFSPRGVLTMTISLPPVRYASPESRERFFAGVVAQTAQLPGVESASACTLLPFGYGERANTFEIVGQPKQPVDPIAELNTVTSDYFKTMGVPVLRGRPFRPQEPRQPLVTVIDAAFARRFFTGSDPLGRQLRMPWGVYTIIGVAGSVKTARLDTDFSPTLYFSAAQSPVTDMTLAIRSGLTGSGMLKHVQRIVAGVDKDQPVYDVATLSDRIDRSLKTRRFVAWLVLASAAAGIGLAALGIYGLQSYLVALRRREIGIRSALGATRGDIAGLVCRGGVAMLSAGMALGSAAAAVACRMVASQLYGVGVSDGVTWVTALGSVAATGLLATALPACRAARQPPAEALRGE